MRRQNWEKQTDGSFLIRDLKLEDEGNFTCHVSNYHGSDEVTYYLQVSAPPSAYEFHRYHYRSDSFKNIVGKK
ncbi:hypothetical protein Avbf_06108 [Armadillidium vulgare]|nr:hypothetical protein Avbf_06108 [Armadillidium vulgare]